jgi:hypothetical protein
MLVRVCRHISNRALDGCSTPRALAGITSPYKFLADDILRDVVLIRLTDRHSRSESLSRSTNADAIPLPGTLLAANMAILAPLGAHVPVRRANDGE